MEALGAEVMLCAYEQSRLFLVRAGVDYGWSLGLNRGHLRMLKKGRGFRKPKQTWTSRKAWALNILKGLPGWTRVPGRAGSQSRKPLQSLWLTCQEWLSPQPLSSSINHTLAAWCQKVLLKKIKNWLVQGAFKKSRKPTTFFIKVHRK